MPRGVLRLGASRRTLGACIAALAVLTSVRCLHATPPGGASSPALAAEPSRHRGRYLYEVSCLARLQKFDTMTGQRIASYDLSSRTGTERLIPPNRGMVETCLANSTVFDEKASVFYTLVPGSEHTDPTQDYKVLGFSIPAVSLVVQRPAGRAEWAEMPWRIEVRPGSVPALVPEPTSESRQLDLSTVSPSLKRVPNQVEAASGRRTLIELLGSKTWTGAIVDPIAKTYVPVGPFHPYGLVHLSPGGTHILVEETDAAGGKIGKDDLYEVATGKLVRTFADARIKELEFRGIAPTGRVLYAHGDATSGDFGNGPYVLFDLGVTFPPDQVTVVVAEDFPPPVVFFADR
jgi:hypothetical protein